MATLGVSSGVSLPSSGDFLQDFQTALTEVSHKFPNLKEEVKQSLAVEVAKKMIA